MDAIFRYFYPNYKEWTVINNHIHPVSMIINKNRYDFYVNEKHNIKCDINEKITLICKSCLFKKKKYLEPIDLIDNQDTTSSFIVIDMPTVDA